METMENRITLTDIDLEDQEFSGMSLFELENSGVLGSPGGFSHSTSEAQDGDACDAGEIVDFTQDLLCFTPLSDHTDHKSSLSPKDLQGQFHPYTPEDQKEKYVGIDTLPKQVHRNTLKNGFEFNLMVVGESGLGKSTLVNNLFFTNLYMDRHLYDASEKINQTVSITKTTVDILENGVKLRLTIVDTPGFGDCLNNDKSWQGAVDYVDQQLEHYRKDEMGINRKNMTDNRVHCCLYFISPHGHGLRPIDVNFMLALHQKVNIVPVLAKADSLTPTEIHEMKAKIRSEIDKYKIKIFQLPESDLDKNNLIGVQDLKDIIPFAVIGSNTVVENNGRKVRARAYPWGVVEVENLSHNDFVHLRNTLIRTHMQHLKDVTHRTLYENYRINVLCKNPCLENE